MREGFMGARLVCARLTSSPARLLLVALPASQMEMTCDPLSLLRVGSAASEMRGQRTIPGSHAARNDILIATVGPAQLS